MDLSMVEVFQSIVIIILIEAQIILFLANGILFKLVPESFFLFFFDIILLVFSFLLSGMTRYARFILCFSCLKSLIRKFWEFLDSSTRK